LFIAHIITPTARINCSRLLEDQLQQLIQDLPLGIRLHKEIYKGSVQQDKNDKDFLGKVFLNKYITCILNYLF